MQETNLRRKRLTPTTRMIQWHYRYIEFVNNQCSTLNIRERCRLCSVYCSILILYILFTRLIVLHSFHQYPSARASNLTGGIPLLLILTSPFHCVRYVQMFSSRIFSYLWYISKEFITVHWKGNIRQLFGYNLNYTLIPRVPCLRRVRTFRQHVQTN